MISGIYTDFQGLEQLKSASRDGQQYDRVLSETANQFEALFLQLVLKSMRTTTIENDLFNSDITTQYRDLLDSQLAISLSQNRPFGIARLVEQQLSASSIDGSNNIVEKLYNYSNNDSQSSKEISP